MVADGPSQQHPAKWREFLCYSKSWDWDSHYFLDGDFHGFRLLDKSPSITPYEVENYGSCFNKCAKNKLNNLISQELSDQKLSLCPEKPTCVHAMGAIIKESGGVRPITDCSKPEGISVNCHTEESFSL